MRDSMLFRAGCLKMALALYIVPLAADTPEQVSASRFRALELGMPDLELAVDFYRQAFGFEVAETDVSGTWILMANGDARLALALSGLPRVAEGTARAYPNFSVGDVEVAGKALAEAGGYLGEPFDSAVGRAVRYVDPFGHPGHLIDHPWDEMAPEATPTLFNVALAVRDIAAAERFYTRLGFRVGTRDYLPQTLVFEPSGSAQLILHASANANAGLDTEGGALLIDTDPGHALSSFATLGSIERTTPGQVPAATTTIEMRDPSGILLKISRGSKPRPASP